jgi:hypothetical protein
MCFYVKQESIKINIKNFVKSLVISNSKTIFTVEKLKNVI